MINPEHKLPLSKQAELLEISRSTIYYRPRPVSDADRMLMRRIDELHMNYPFAGKGVYQSALPYGIVDVVSSSCAFMTSKDECRSNSRSILEI
jgi:putative transposase